MNRREILLKICGLAGIPVGLGGCSMDAIRRAETQMDDRLRHPGTGVQFSGLPEVVKIIVLANYPATPHQAQVAEKRAKAAVVRIARRKDKKPQSSLAKVGENKAATIPKASPAASDDSDAKIAAAVLQLQAGTPIIAVDTTPDTRLRGTRAIMLWNTEKERLVDNTVYDTASNPMEGQVAQLGETTASYVGAN